MHCYVVFNDIFYIGLNYRSRANANWKHEFGLVLVKIWHFLKNYLIGVSAGNTFHKSLFGRFETQIKTNIIFSEDISFLLSEKVEAIGLDLIQKK